MFMFCQRDRVIDQHISVVLKVEVVQNVDDTISQYSFSIRSCFLVSTMLAGNPTALQSIRLSSQFSAIGMSRIQ